MKKTWIVLATLSVLLMVGCKGKNGQKSNTVTPTEVPEIDDKGIAFEVFLRIPKEDLDEKFRTKTYTCPEDCRRHFGDSEGNDSDAELYMEGGNSSFSVDCFPLNNGGWLALLVNEGCFDGCEQIVKTYLFKDGVLHFASDVLPHPTMEEMVDDPFLVFGIDEEEVQSFKSEWDSRYLYYVYGNDTLSVGVETLNYDDLWMSALHNKQYVWDGERFVEIYDDTERVYTIIERGALGMIRLGDMMPESVADFSRQEQDGAVLFSRNGKPYFKLLPDDLGRIEAIDVMTPKYAYFRGKVGDTLNKLLYKGGAENTAFFKDGNFVVTDASESSDDWIDYIGPTDAIDGNFMEGPIEDPRFKLGAKVQYVRLYRHNNWENDTCDMRMLYEALRTTFLHEGKPECSKNDFHYFRELYNLDCDSYCDYYVVYVHCYPMKKGGFKVYATSYFDPGWEEDPSDGGYTQIKAYIYKDGVATEVEPEPELNVFSMREDGYYDSVSGIYFYDRTMTVATGRQNDKLTGMEFTWDGTSMKKTFEGTFEN